MKIYGIAIELWGGYSYSFDGVRLFLSKEQRDKEFEALEDNADEMYHTFESETED